MFKRKKIMLSVAILLMAGFAYAVFIPRVGVQQSKARESFQKGMLLWSNYNYSASIDFFLESLSYDAEFTLARRMLGQVLYYSGRIDDALNEWQILFDRDYYDPSLQLHMESLRSFQVAPEPKWRYLKKIKKESGFRYSYPTFVDTIDNNSVIILSQNEKNDASLMILNSNGVFIENFRRISEKLQMPMGAAFNGEELWVSDMQADIIHRLRFDFSRDDEGDSDTLDALGGPGEKELEFRGPAGICYNGKNFFVADQGNNRIQKISPQGVFLQEIRAASFNSPLIQPFGISCDADNLYVTEPQSSRISHFDNYGNFIEYVLENETVTPRHLKMTNDYLIVSDEVKGIILLDRKSKEIIVIDGYYPSDENKKEKFLRPYAATTDIFGNLYVSDYGSHDIIQFVPEQFLYSNLEVWVERIDSADYPQVGIWVSVKDQFGNRITGLDSDNFKVYENDADVGIVGTEHLGKFRDISRWVVLNSKSRTMKKYKDSILWVSDFFLNNIHEHDRIEVLSYGDTVRTDSEWTNSRLRLHQALEMNSETDFATDNVEALGKAVYTGVTELLPEKGSRGIIWITDGNIRLDAMGDFSLARLENYARNNHIPVFILSFENPDIPQWKDNIKVLQEFAKKTQGKYYSIYKDNLNLIDEDLRSVKEDRYVLYYKSNGDRSWKDQYMDIKVYVHFQGRTGMETAGYFIQ
ncbi:MAG: hypothetical protein ABUK01_05580 [Leptospirales bacterium]